MILYIFIDFILENKSNILKYLLKLVIYAKLISVNKVENMEKEKDKVDKVLSTTRKYLLPGKSMKPYMADILTKEGILGPYSVEYEGPDYIEKIYFDTRDRFFFNNGLLITMTKSKAAKMHVLEVRQEGEDKRIHFISEMPKNRILEIEKKDYFSAHFDFISESLLAIRPSGLGVNIPSYVNSIIPVFMAVKKASRYRIINNNGMKAVLSFEEVEFINNANRNKHKQYQLEIKLEDIAKHDLFETFIKRLILQVPTIIPIKHSDILNGLDYTSMEDTKKSDLKKLEKKDDKTPKKK